MLKLTSDSLSIYRCTEVKRYSLVHLHEASSGPCLSMITDSNAFRIALTLDYLKLEREFDKAASFEWTVAKMQLDVQTLQSRS